MIIPTGLIEVIYADLTSDGSPSSGSPIDVDDNMEDMIRQPSLLVASMIDEHLQPGTTTAAMDSINKNTMKSTRSVMIPFMIPYTEENQPRIKGSHSNIYHTSGIYTNGVCANILMVVRNMAPSAFPMNLLKSTAHSIG